MTTEVTRVRIEARGAGAQDVVDELIGTAAKIRSMLGGSWEQPSEPLIQHAKGGHWGFYVIVRMSDDGT
jgi:hypothetical protein